MPSDSNPPATAHPLRVGFVLQGEGGGHATQAVTLAGMLRAAGHEVVSVRLGGAPEWATSPSFERDVGTPVSRFLGPTHVMDRERRAIGVGRTAASTLVRLPAFVRSALGHAKHLGTEQCDVVVSFLDVTSSYVRAAGLLRTPTLLVGHHYTLLHPDTPLPALPLVSKLSMRGYIWMSTWRARSRLALSFRPLPDLARNDTRICPPLLRPELRTLAAHDGGYLLAYTLTPGSGDHVVAWQRRNPGAEVHLYVAGGERALGERPGEGCHVHDLDSDSFIRRMAGCRAYVGTAGFESLCEAHYLGKPVMAIPVRNQIEQRCNAWEAQTLGIARMGSFDDLDDFWATAKAPEPKAVESFRVWVDSATAVAVRAVEETAR